MQKRLSDGAHPVIMKGPSVGGFTSSDVTGIGGIQMIFVLINVLVIIVVGAILFYLIDRFVRDGRLANLLKILVVLICLAAILQRLLPALGVSLF